MSDFPERYSVVYVTSSDGENWSQPQEIKYQQSLHGAQLTVFGGEVWGVITSATKNQPKFLSSVSYSKKYGWTTKYLDKKYRAEGRASVAALGDRLYVLYRGTNNGVYLIYTRDGVNWIDLGRIGSKYSETHQSPAIHPVGDKLLLAGVGADGFVYYTITDKDGKREQSWTKLGTSVAETFGGLAFANYNFSESSEYLPKAVLFRATPQLFQYGYQDFYAYENGSHSWGQFIGASQSTGGVSAAPYTPDDIFVVFMDTSRRLCSQTLSIGTLPRPAKLLTTKTSIFSEPGVAYLDGELIVSYAAWPEREDAARNTYVPPAVMDEKMALAQRDAQWDCKWKKEDTDGDKKVDLQSLINGCFCL